MKPIEKGKKKKVNILGFGDFEFDERSTHFDIRTRCEQDDTALCHNNAVDKDGIGSTSDLHAVFIPCRGETGHDFNRSDTHQRIINLNL